MKKIMLAGFAVLLLFGCSQIEVKALREASVSTPIPSSAPAYAGPKATIAMAPVEGLNIISSGWGGAAVGPEINAVFESSLMATGKFRLVSRDQLKPVLQEQDLSAAGRVSESTKVKSGEITGADLLVKAKITGFDPGYSSASAAIGAIGRAMGGWAGVLGAVIGGISQSRLVVNVLVIDTRTSEAVFSQPFEANATSWGAGGGIGAQVFGGVSYWKGTPMEEALRKIVEAASASVSTKIPAQYFKH